MIKKFLVFAFFPLLLFSSCNKNDKDIANKDLSSDEDTLSLTPSEAFAFSLTQDILLDDRETDLETYLEKVIFPAVKDFNKVTINKISDSEYLVICKNEKNEMRIQITKYYNLQNGEIFFEQKIIN